MRHSFGSIVKAYRERKRLTQLELAVKSKGELSTATISKAETDPSYNPKLTTFIKFYKIMDVSFEDIVATLEGTADDK
ncbi:helix-turn-helix transcriptional regulator [Leuconostoc suionicum]|uniref:helix-turn-helix transcriptional regulator n=1 Tax=Leuconostoc suionicum TaxID=1511761 RepID=UPI003748E25B